MNHFENIPHRGDSLMLGQLSSLIWPLEMHFWSVWGSYLMNLGIIFDQSGDQFSRRGLDSKKMNFERSNKSFKALPRNHPTPPYKTHFPTSRRWISRGQKKSLKAPVRTLDPNSITTRRKIDSYELIEAQWWVLPSTWIMYHLWHIISYIDHIW